MSKARWRQYSVPLAIIGAVIGLMIVPAADAQQLPVINAPFADKPVEPTRFSPSQPHLLQGSVNNYVRSIKWSSWGGVEAVGTGKVSLLRGTTATQFEPSAVEETSPVTVHLAGQRQCLGVSVYTSYTLELAAGAEAPIGWPLGQTGSFPCQRIESASFEGNRHYATECPYTGLEPPADGFGENPRFKAPSWAPHLPAKRIRTLAFCQLHASHWGDPQASLSGLGLALLHPYRQDHVWPVKLELLDPLWCPAAVTEEPWPRAAAITYGAIKLTLYGNGKDWQPGSPASAVEHQGLSGKVYWQRIHPQASECDVGLEARNPVLNTRS